MRTIFHPADDPLLNYLREDNNQIEPEWYITVLPLARKELAQVCPRSSLPFLPACSGVGDVSKCRVENIGPEL